MKAIANAPNGRALGVRWPWLAALLLAALECAAAKPVSPCCYNGEVTESELAALELTLADGTTQALTEAFPGLLDEGAGGGQPLHPARWRYLRQASTLGKTAPEFDANDDGNLDHQELLVLVIVEAARGIGINARGVAAGGQPVRALAITGNEIELLTGWVKRNAERLNEHAVSLFADVDDLRTRRPRSGGGST